MGASSSTPGAAHVGTAEKRYGALPDDPMPFPGPFWEYRILAIFSKLKGHISFGAGAQMTSSNLEEYYGQLQQQYGEFYKLATFFKIPLSRGAAGFTSVQIPFQAIFTRPTVYTPSHERWSMAVESTTIQLSLMGGGSLFSYGRIGEEVSGIYDIIQKHATQGGRLICMECSGNNYNQGFSFGKSPHFGVDLFFDIPQHPNPTIYLYAAHSTPMMISYGYGSIQCTCDYNGTLSAYLNQGWRLVDVFIAQQELCYGQGGKNRVRPRQLNTIWFFEKEAALANDPTPKYQVTYINYFSKVKGGFGGVNAEFDVSELIKEMGAKGWTLVSILDVPEMYTSGMTTVQNTVLCFFQRPVLQPGAMPPPAAMAPPVMAAPPMGAEAPPQHQEAPPLEKKE